MRRFRRSMEVLGLGNIDKLAAAYAEAAKAARADLDKRCKTEKRKPTNDEIGEAADAAGAVIDERFFRIVAEVCSNVITAEQIAQIPGRVFRNWFAWLWREFIGDLASSDAPRSPLVGLNHFEQERA
jgi:hypothetical protein